MSRADQDAQQVKCEHKKVMPAYEPVAANLMTAFQVRQHFPRFAGECPDCGFDGVIYASFEHYIAGDW